MLFRSTHIGDEYTGIGEESLIQQIENDIYTIETKEEAAKYSEEYGADLDELLDFMKIGGNTNGN